MLEHLQPTAGVSFVRLALHLDSLPAGDFSLVMLLARLLTLAGTPEESPEQLSQRIGRLTGGISFEAHALDHTGGAVLPVMVVTGVAEYQQAGDLTGLMGEMLISPRLERDGSQALVAGTLDSEVANIESDMLSNGLSPSLLRSEAMLSGSRWVAEQLSGVTHLEALRSARFNLTHGGWERLKGRLERLQSALVTASRQQPVISVTGDAVALEGSRGAVKDLLRRLAAARSGSEPSSGHREWPTLPLRSEALVLTSGNNHVVSSALLPPETYQYSGASQMAATLLEEFLYSELRAKRGAYGAYSRLRRSGLLSMYTYRDPGLQTTVGVFRDASRYLVGFARDPDVQDLQRAVIAGVNMIDGYMPISERGWAALVDHLTGRTDDVRQKEKDELLAASAADVEALGTAMEKASFTLVAATTADAVQVANSGEVMFDASIAISPSRLVESDP